MLHTKIVLLASALAAAAGGTVAAVSLSTSAGTGPGGQAGSGSSGSSGSAHGAGGTTTTSFALPSPPTTAKREVDAYVASGSGTMHMVETESGSCSGTIVADLDFSIASGSVLRAALPGGALSVPVSASNSWESPTGLHCTFAGRSIDPIPASAPQTHPLAASLELTLGPPASANLKVPSAMAAASFVNAGCGRVIAGSNGHVQVCSASLEVLYSLPAGLTSGTGKLKCTPSSTGQTAMPLSGSAPSTTKAPSCKMSPSSTYSGTLDLASQPCFDFVSSFLGEHESCADTGSLSLKVKTEKSKYRSAPVLSPARVTFPDQRAGTSSPDQTFTLTNEASGSAPLIVAGLGITGSAHSMFPVSADHCTGAVLQPGQSCTFAVAFAPGSGDHGAEDATLKVVTDAKIGILTSALYASALAAGSP